MTLYEHVAPGPGYYNTDSSFITKSFNTRVTKPRKVMSAKGRKRNNKKLPTVSPYYIFIYYILIESNQLDQVDIV